MVADHQGGRHQGSVICDVVFGSIASVRQLSGGVRRAPDRFRNLCAAGRNKEPGAASRAAKKSDATPPFGRTNGGVVLSKSCQRDVPESPGARAAAMPSAGK